MQDLHFSLLPSSRDQSNQKPPFCQKPRGLLSSVWNPPSIHCQMLFGYLFRNPHWRLFAYLLSTCCLPSKKELQCLVINSLLPLSSPPLLGPQHSKPILPLCTMTVWPQLWYPPLGFALLMTSCGLMEDTGHRLKHIQIMGVAWM